MIRGRRRLFFCINSGRSGSEYLASLLDTAEEVESHHEAEPTMHGPFLDLVNSSPYENSFKERLSKARAIRRRLRQLPRGGVYSETNHMFIKTFWDVVMDRFDHRQIEIIVLRRELSRTLKSFIDLAYFTPRNHYSLMWMTSPNARTAAIPSLKRDEEMDQYELCISYLIDIEARAVRFMAQFPDIRTHEVRLESLNSKEGVDRLFNELRVQTTSSTDRALGRAVNERSSRKAEFSVSTSLENCREHIQAHLDEMRAAGSEIPASLPLDTFAR